MNLAQQLARHLREVHFGENWTWSNLKDHLKDLSWEEATLAIYSCNSIATLVFHMNYYLNAVSDRVRGNPLTAKHELSLVHPPIQNQQDWEKMVTQTWTDAENFARFIEQMPEGKLWENISEKYGSFYRNIQGVIEHNHYHLGQIVVLKKIIRAMQKEEMQSESILIKE
jgi:hypothetical protein